MMTHVAFTRYFTRPFAICHPEVNDIISKLTFMDKVNHVIATGSLFTQDQGGAATLVVT